MTDPLKRLEDELSRMQPRSLPRGVSEGIESELTSDEAKPSPWPDRCLLSAIFSGALAACVIVAVLLSDLRGSAPVTEAMKPTNADAPRFGDSVLAVARADAKLDNVWK